MNSSANDRPHSELLDLTERHCNGELSDAGVDRLESILLSDAEARAFFRRYLALDASLSYYGESAAADPSAVLPSPVAFVDSVDQALKVVRDARDQEIVVNRRRTRRRVKYGIGLAVVTALAIVFAASNRSTFIRPQLATAIPFGSLGELTGDVRVSGANGHTRVVESDVTVRPGDTVQTRGTDGSAVLAYRGVRLTLVGNTSITCGDVSSMSVVVHQGALAASVPPQAAGMPLRFLTPTAEVQVLGTRFFVAAAPDRTDLSVIEGRVRVVRTGDRKTVEVPNGKFVSVRHQDEPIVQKNPQLTATWEADFEIFRQFHFRQVSKDFAR